MDNTLLVAENKFSKYVGAYRVGIAALFIAASVVTWLAFRGHYIALVWLILSLLLWFLFTMFLTRFLSLREVRITSESLELINIITHRKKIIPRQGITAWTEVPVRGKGDGGDALRLYSDIGTICIRSTTYKNYEALRELVTGNIRRDTDKERRLNALGALQFSIPFGIMAIVAITGASTPPVARSNDLVRVSGIVAGDLTIQTGKGSKWINIDLAGYPGFKIEDDAVGLARAGGLTRLTVNDSLFVDIRKADYRRVITHEMPAGYWDRHFGFSRIDVLGAGSGSTVFFTPDQGYAAALKTDKHTRKALLITGIVASLIALISLGTYVRKVRGIGMIPGNA